MALLPWKVLSRRSLLAIAPWLEVSTDRVELPDGRVIEDYYTIKLLDFAVVVAVTSDGFVVAERHYKHSLHAVTLCLPAGYLSDNEAPIAAAQRELLEETGYVSDQWTPLGAFVLDGNRGCGTAHFFLASRCVRVQEPGTGDLEDMQVELLSLDEMVDQMQSALQSGQAQEICTATALSLAYMHVHPYNLRR